MTVRSAVLDHSNNTLAGGGSVDLATVPAGELWLLKDWNVYISSVTAGAIIHAGVFSGGILVPWVRSAAPVAGDVLTLRGAFVTLAAGDTLRLLSQTQGCTLRSHASGAKLVL